MSEIELRFNVPMELAAEVGRKFCTSRREQHGAIGDTFKTTHYTYKIIAVAEMRLWEVCKYLYYAEGFNSPSDFSDEWIKIYRTYEPFKKVWVHWFVKTS